MPIPPELVATLRAHVETFGVGPGGRLFRTSNGGPIGSSAYWLVWERARKLGLAPGRAESPLAGRPYDLRHAGVSLWLNAGVPATEVARRAGTVLTSYSRSTPVASTATSRQPTNG